MTKVILAILAAITLVLIALGVWRWTDKRASLVARASLVSHQPSAPATFDPSMIARLPDPAQRFFWFAIATGTPLYSVAEISLEGEFSLGNKVEPNYMPMRAEQILAAPHGFVWEVRAGNGVWFSGSDGANDGASWSRFWLFGIAPVARAGNNDDHARSAFGRYVAEAVFWTPAALLPGDGVQWEPVDDFTARVTVTHMGLDQAAEVTVGADGQPSKVVFQRWSNANPEKIFQLQPFGGYLSNYKDFGGFRLPTRVEAGNFFETDDYFAFFKANVTSVRFPAAGGN
ncbi:MAG: DUF6544 family protein [Woeseiaceae bacterium]